MAKSLTKKQRGFVKEYVATGNGTKSALKSYDTKSENTAAVIATRLLRKDKIQEVVQSALDDDLLNETHMGLMKATRLDHMVFPLGPQSRIEKELDLSEMPQDVRTIFEAEQALQHTDLSDDEIKAMLADVNCTVRRIVHGETARHVYFWAADNKARKDALEMSYKIKGSFAPEKHVNVNIEVEANEKIKSITAEINALHRGGGITSNGGAASPVGGEAPDQEREGTPDRVQQA